ncbi:MAG: acyltransferase [Clostridia bacterium]|nr:acyltransferase [Clostridia bacterium]
MKNFWTKKFNSLSEEQKESFYKTVFLSDDSEFAKQYRKEYYSKLLKKMGDDVEIGKDVKIVNPQYVSLGKGVKIGDGVTLIARGEGGIEIGNGVLIQERVYIDTQTEEFGYVKVGANTYIGTGTTIFGHVGLEIGENCLLAQNITITPYSHKHSDANTLICKQGGFMEKVTIGDNSYLGMGVCVMYSGNIGEGAVIGAHSTVVKEIPPYTVAVGTPAKVIKNRKGD